MRQERVYDLSEPNAVYLSLLGLLVASLSSIGQRHTSQAQAAFS